MSLKRLYKKLFFVLILGTILLPSFAIANSTSLQVNQSICTQAQPCTGGSGGGGGNTVIIDSTAPQIFDVAVTATYFDAVISWSTNEISLGKISWGKNQDYSDGEILVEQYAKKHQAEILKLEDQTQYYFKIIAFDQAGNERVYVGRFLTLTEPDLTPPLNVFSFTVTPTQDSFKLSWINPRDADFDSVRIVRSQIFFPLDPFNGLVVYEGQDQFMSDGAVVPGTTYYYSIFAKDVAGNYSTGAIGAGQIIWYSDAQSQYPDAPVVDIKFPTAPGGINNPASFNDFTIIYNHGSTIVGADNPQVPAGADIKIVVPQSELPEGTESLMLTVKDETSGAGESNYLFAFNKLTGEFFVTVPALVVKESYRLVITIFNSAKQVLQTIGGSIEVFRDKANNIIVESSGGDIPKWVLVLTPALIIAAVLYFINNFSWVHLLSFPSAPSPPQPQPKPKSRTRRKPS